MTLIKILLATLALSAGLLLAVDHAIAPGGSAPNPAAGLTAAAVLASDGMAPDGRPGQPDPDPSAHGPRAVAAVPAS